MVHNSASKKEYLSRRERDIKRTNIVENFTDLIYKKNGLQIKRVTDRKMQTKGVDIIHQINGETRYIDEKFAIQYYNKDLHTFAFELSSHNNYDNNGWFTSEHMITTHYAILWFKADDEFKNIYQYDLCYISKEKIKEYLKTVGYYDDILDDFNKYWEYRWYTEPDDTYYEQNGRRYKRLRNGVKIVQSMQFEVESPINVVIPRRELYKLAEYHFHS